MKKLSGVPASGGLAVGKVRVITRRTEGISRSVSTPHGEKALFEAAKILARDELTEIIENASEHDAEIFNFQRLILDDKGYNNTVFEAIEQGAGAAAATEEATAKYIQKLHDVGDDYISLRSEDLQDINRRLLNILDGTPETKLNLTGPVIVLAKEIMPSDLITADRNMIQGFITGGGSAQGHAAIIARTIGIPAVVAVGDAVFEIEDGTTIALDGGSGEVFVEPDESTVARFLHRIGLAQRKYLSLEKLKQSPCITKDGEEFYLYANCSSKEDIETAIENGAMGVGLLRSEFLLMQQAEIPNEEEQYLFYKNCLLAAGEKPVTVRTFDIGADKAITGISLQKEENPALGLRGLRLALAQQSLFENQVRALLRAGLHGNLKVMFPMVAEPKELDTALQLVENIKAKLEKENVSYCKTIEWGIMIETPAAALLADELAEKASFFSIGTNDLTQYTLAADRTNTAVAEYFNPTSNAVIRLMQITTDAAVKHGLSVSVCGESAADEHAVLQYARMGLRHFSVAGSALLYVKEILMENMVKENM
jgi:phosphoenolpyruvate-protein phosphotransferase